MSLNPLSRGLLRHLTWLVALTSGFFQAGCGDSPQAPVQGTGPIEASIDPGTSTFLLGAATIPGPDGTPIPVDLVGKNLRVESPAGGAGVVVALDVSVRNASTVALYPPAEIIIGNVRGDIEVMGRDWIRCLRSVPGGCTYGFVYSDLLGPDGILAPGEESGIKAWRFGLPGPAEPFTFSVRASLRFDPLPDQAAISGRCFFDPNENGIFDAGDGPAGGVLVRVTRPDLTTAEVFAGDDGSWSVGVAAPGLHTLEAVPPPTFAPVHFTTPNPLAVVVTPAPDGAPQGFAGADFGIANDIRPADPVRFHPGPASAIKQDPFGLADAALQGTALELKVQFGGCSPDHPFALYMVSGFQESIPVQATLILSHDARGEACRAIFQRALLFDLQPIRDAYLRIYGRLDPVKLNLRLPDGGVRSFILS